VYPLSSPIADQFLRFSSATIPDCLIVYFVNTHCQTKNTANETMIVTNGLRVTTHTPSAAIAPTSCGFRQLSSTPAPCGAKVIGTMIAVNTVTGTKLSAVRTDGENLSRSPKANAVHRMATVMTAMPRISNT
jgi:hypothetical protein